MTTSPAGGRVAGLFDRVAGHYDARWLQTAVYRPAQDCVLAELRLQQVGGRIIDAGCGTGIFAARLVDELHPDLVVGADLSAGMLTEASKRSGAVAWLQADCGRLPLREASVEAFVATQSFHFFDQPVALAEFRRVLVPGGHLMIGMINLRTSTASRRLERVVGRVLGAAATWPTQSRMRSLLEAAGFEVRAQRRVSWAFGRLAPTVVTVARARLSGE